MERLVLVAHGSRDARAARSTWALTRAVALAREGSGVTAAFLGFERPGLADALAAVGGKAVTVVPLLLTPAYHGRIDVPAQAAAAGAAVALSEVLGPVGPADTTALDLVVLALRRRLAEALEIAPSRYAPDAVVLAAAGTRVESARTTVDLVAAALRASLGVPCLPGYASGSGPSVAEAVAALRAAGARRVAVAAYFLAPGRLFDRAVRQAESSGAVVVAAPLGAVPEIVQLVLLRADTQTPRGDAGVSVRVCDAGGGEAGQSEWARTRMPPRRLRARRSSSLIPPQTPAS